MPSLEKDLTSIDQTIQPLVSSRFWSSTSSGRSLAPKARKCGSGLPWNAKYVVWLDWPLVNGRARSAGNSGSHCHQSIGNARCATAISGSSIRWCCLPNVLAQSARNGRNRAYRMVQQHLRQRCANLVRRALSFSKDKYWHELRIHLFIDRYDRRLEQTSYLISLGKTTTLSMMRCWSGLTGS
jgi:hypothetical protein